MEYPAITLRLITTSLPLFVLRGTIGTSYPGSSLGNMFRSAVVDAFAPQTKRTWLHVGTHQGDYLLLADTKTCANGIEGGSVLPRHFYNSG